MTTTYATRLSHTARCCSGDIVSSPGGDKFCKGGGGRTSENDRGKGTATGPEGLVTISDGGADVVAPEGVAAAVPLTELDLISWSLEPRKFVCDDIAGWEGGLEGWGG